MLPLLATALLQTATLPAVTHDVFVASPGGHTIAGVLELPVRHEPPPVVILIGGAGPDHRNTGTILTSDGSNGTFVALSTALRSRGLAVVRFDEVGTGASTGHYARTATTRALAEDVGALVRALEADLRVDGRRIALVGFSEGSVIAAIVAGRHHSVVAVAALSAPARAGAAIMRYQDSLRVAHASAADSAKVRAEVRAADSTRRANEPWYREFLALDPVDAWRTVRVPTLVVAGARDELVPPEDAIRIAETFSNRACVTTLVAPRLGHSLVEDIWERNPESLDPALMAALVNWTAQSVSGRCAQRNAACCR